MIDKNLNAKNKYFYFIEPKITITASQKNVLDRSGAFQKRFFANVQPGIFCHAGIVRICNRNCTRFCNIISDFPHPYDSREEVTVEHFFLKPEFILKAQILSKGHCKNKTFDEHLLSLRMMIHHFHPSIHFFQRVNEFSKRGFILLKE